MEQVTALVASDATTPAARRAEARKLAQVRKLSAQLARCEKAITDGSVVAGWAASYEFRATELRGQIAARLVGRCRECHRVLTDPISVAAGIGPECATLVA